MPNSLVIFMAGFNDAKTASWDASGLRAAVREHVEWWTVYFCFEGASVVSYRRRKLRSCRYTWFTDVDVLFTRVDDGQGNQACAIQWLSPSHYFLYPVRWKVPVLDDIYKDLTGQFSGRVNYAELAYPKQGWTGALLGRVMAHAGVCDVTRDSRRRLSPHLPRPRAMV